MHSNNHSPEHSEDSIRQGQDLAYGQSAALLKDAAVRLEEAATMLTQAATLLEGDRNADDRDGNGHARSLPEWVGKAVQWARDTVNNPDTEYEYGGAGPLKFDCSGFTSGAFAAAGKQLDRPSRKQYYQADVHVPLVQARPGDLVFWSNNGSGSAIYHVALVISEGKIAHARNKDEDLSITGIKYSPWNMLDVAGRFH